MGAFSQKFSVWFMTGSWAPQLTAEDYNAFAFHTSSSDIVVLNCMVQNDVDWMQCKLNTSVLVCVFRAVAISLDKFPNGHWLKNLTQCWAGSCVLCRLLLSSVGFQVLHGE